MTYCDIKGYRYPEQDCYGWARLCQVIGNFIGGTTSIGIDEYSKLDKDNGDNGVYVIEKWKIVDRLYFIGYEQHEHDMLSMLKEINKAQPKEEQIPEEELIREYEKLNAPLF